jgi:LuxR family quorum-sensing system transcriptional regulator CciR
MVKPLSRLADVNHFIAASRAARSADDLRALMDPITREMGFHCYALFQHVAQFSWGQSNALAISNFPRSWLNYFVEHRLSAEDPVHVASSRTAVGFAFDHIPNLIKVSDRQEKIMEASRRAGLTDGFCVPAHIPGEANGTCTFVMQNGAELPRENFPMAQLVGSFAYEAARQLLLKGNKLVRTAPSEPLTSRQLECIILVGKGKTDWEIAKVLGIRKDTVKEHLEEARRRCGVSRRSELPIHALYRGSLQFGDIIN